MNIDNVFIDRLRFKSDGTSYWGDVNSFGVIASKMTGGIGIFISFDNSEEKVEILHFLEELKNSEKIISFKRTPRGVDLYLKSELISDDSQIEDLIYDFTDNLYRFGVVNVCSFCSKESAPGFIKLNNSLVQSCNQCIDEKEQKINEQLSVPNNYFTGTIGALLGALLGSVVWILIGQLGYVASLGGIAIAIAAIKGYDIFRGKRTRVTAFIIAFSILFGLFFAEYIAIMLASFKYDESWTVMLWLQQTPYLFMEDNLMDDMMPGIGMGLLFAALGSFRIIRAIAKEKTILPSLERV